MIIVLGATGNVGEKIAKLLLAREEKIRVIARHKEKLAELGTKGAEVCAGDISDTQFLTYSLRKGDAAFTMIPPNLQAPSLVEHYRKMSESITRAVIDSGIKYIVNLSSLGADLEKGTGPIKALHEHEQRLNQLKDVNILHLRPTYFMENLLWNIPSIKSREVMGSPIKGDVSMPMIATQDIAAVAAKRLVARDFKGKTVQVLLGERDLTLHEAAGIISCTLGRTIPYVTFEYPSARAALLEMGLSHDTADQFLEMSDAFNRGLISSKGLRDTLNTTPTSFEKFAGVFKKLLGDATKAA